MFSAMFSFLVPLTSSGSVNLFSEGVHPSTNLRGMSLTEISCALQDLSNCNLTKCFAVYKVTAPMKLMPWPIGFEAVSADPVVPSSPQDCIYWDIYVTIIFGFLFFDRILIFCIFCFLRISELHPDHVFKISSMFTRLGSPFFSLHLFISLNLRGSNDIGVESTRTRYLRSHNKIRWDSSTNEAQGCSKDREKGFLMPLCRGEKKIPMSALVCGPGLAGMRDGRIRCQLVQKRFSSIRPPGHSCTDTLCHHTKSCSGLTGADRKNSPTDLRS